jgi:hypothetical protein
MVAAAEMDDRDRVMRIIMASQRDLWGTEPRVLLIRE